MLKRSAGRRTAPLVASGARSTRLSANESPFGPLPSVLEAIQSAASEINRYPDDEHTALVAALAARFGVPQAHVAVGSGSAGVLQMVLEALGEPGAEVVYAWRSFGAYPLLVGLSGATAVEVPLGDDKHDLIAMANAITDKTRAVIICNPNNPTGTTVSRAELERFLNEVPTDCLVILDEAYREYVQDEDFPDGLGLCRGRPNVAVLRTFSKAYGMAGLRVGFLVGDPDMVAAVRAARLPFSVTNIAQAAAVASLAAEDELLSRVESTVAERDRVRSALLAQGWSVPPSGGNFLWLPLGEATASYVAACQAAGVHVRAFGSDGIRVSIGLPEENDAFLDLAAAAAEQKMRSAR
ncbi:histidinol-phosphate transaminase [Kribbella sp. CA-294648]|uniref:histidinol-phosphate transaminase n=1 Tax=Kribbella sp. CA-294648 TaxID=3239948 RepID=UPI003D945792